MRSLIPVLLCCLLLPGAAMAKLSHVSINKSQFTLGEHPRLRVNIIAERNDLSRLEFVVQQGESEEKLMVQPLNSFMLLLTGVEEVRDPNARLLVREYVVDQWHEYRWFPLFAGASGKLTENAVPARASELREKGTQASVAAAMPRGAQAPVQIQEAPVKTQEASVETEEAPTKTELAPQVEIAAAIAEPTVDLANRSAANECEVERQAGDTLWRIANRNAAKWQVDVYSAMLALFDANPGAFTRNKINGLKKDARLECPGTELLGRYPDPKVASRVYADKEAGQTVQ
ncbi:FimV/HubP family polar landmark protein [Shewanella sedimentimangrovi]|uniref:Fimbrial protein FimV n=1 Tax=Shewanella sedimentimangrovi TaxID=2814293 RepID=A0ABX7R111_9GAMM|nr:FimV/HubP family polar landmark protein [Shewanella sedimentimangrovi]QSX36866.1 fimbrial protein FimV [Shewanella sedimentimangrovi]